MHEVENIELGDQLLLIFFFFQFLFLEYFLTCPIFVNSVHNFGVPQPGRADYALHITTRIHFYINKVLFLFDEA